MTVRMTFPSFVARATRRIVLGGLVAAAAIAVAGLVVERTKLGGDVGASRARLRAEVEGQFASLTNRVDAAVRAVTVEAETVRRSERGDAPATRLLFDQVAASAARTGVAVTIYGAASEPLAWLGRTLSCQRVDDAHADCRDSGRPDQGFPAQDQEFRRAP